MISTKKIAATSLILSISAISYTASAATLQDCTNDTAKTLRKITGTQDAISNSKGKISDIQKQLLKEMTKCYISTPDFTKTLKESGVNILKFNTYLKKELNN